MTEFIARGSCAFLRQAYDPVENPLVTVYHVSSTQMVVYSEMALRVIDLFCGPGGFSSGFEAAGFEIVAALDYDTDAVTTFTANHGCAAKQQDLSDFDYSELPDADIVIGGPPCTQFSSAKSNRTRNVLDGLLLVQSFLRCVYLKKPKYWIMENVPTIQKYLPNKVPLRSIGIDSDGYFPIPTKVELVAADYGVPQKRRRYLIGNFPVPEPTHHDASARSIFTADHSKTWKTMRDVLSFLPDPLGERKPDLVSDPNYPVSIPSDQLSDHFYDARFTEVERRSIHQAKTQHPYMGKLSWPDKLDRPARTVVATQLGRETLVLPAGENDFRRATVRECACFQSFPITYQFFGKSFGSKYRQAGDAVPPKLSFALAREIARKEGLQVDEPAVRKTVESLANAIPLEKLRRKRKPNFKRKANFLMPSKEVRGTRCELFVESFDANLVEVGGHSLGSPIWQADLVLGEGAGNTERFLIDEKMQISISKSLAADPRVAEQASSILADWSEQLARIASGAEVYVSYILEEADKSPLRLVEEAKQITDNYMPTIGFHNLHIDCSHFINHPKANRLKVRVLIGCLMSFALTTKWRTSWAEASLHSSD